jgi:hypothetical protein
MIEYIITRPPAGLQAVHASIPATVQAQAGQEHAVQVA